MYGNQSQGEAYIIATIVLQNIFVQFITILITALAIAGIGYFVAIILRIKMRYKAVFNMAIYSLTLSVILQTIYNAVNIFWEFTIPLFQVMYIGVAFIYLIASLFITRIDIMKMQEELTKVKEVQKQIKKEKEQEKEKEKEKNKEKDKEKDKTKEKEKEKSKDKKEEKKQEENKNKEQPKEKKKGKKKKQEEEGNGEQPEGSNI